MNVATAKTQGVANGDWSWNLGEGCRQECQDAGHENLGNVGNLGNLPEKTKENDDSAGPAIEGCQDSQDCQSAPATAGSSAKTTLDPDRPGPKDLLNKEQRDRYDVVYYSRPASMSPSEKHARAWRATVAGGKE